MLIFEFRNAGCCLQRRNLRKSQSTSDVAVSLTEPSSLCTFWSTSSTLQASSAYKAIKILLVVSELLTKPHSLLFSVHSLLATTHRHDSTVDVRPQLRPGTPHSSPTWGTQDKRTFLLHQHKTNPERLGHQLGIIPSAKYQVWRTKHYDFFLFLFLICLLFSAFVSHLSRKIPTSDISKHFSGATVYKLAQHSTDTNFLRSLNAEFITRH